MSDPPRGLPQSLRNYYLQLFGAALAYILFAVIMLHAIEATREHPAERNSLAALILYVLGLGIFLIYVNILWLRRKYPVNWAVCTTIAVALSLGNAFLLIAQDPTTLVHVLEVIALMCIFGSLGSWQPRHLSPVRYATIVSFGVLLLTGIALVLVYFISKGKVDIMLYLVHGLLTVAMCPLMIFQVLVFNGLIWGVRPILDIPLCSVILLMDFLAAYTFVDADDEIAHAFEILSESNLHRMGRMLDT
ncbi:hypothetical protein AWZ03_010374 [Drosophila navojoa]|uniref:Uncharacterized protein n=1 Tax=Drosophila navojoa TaxID=7232 RepID=A0A484B3H3_DRONA|nr:uncharacterized protein LOC115563800 [Drosophila navojoa]TDG43214.1 hypothetical protein AWZ03_010374 [Drosophila navojoa]